MGNKIIAVVAGIIASVVVSLIIKLIGNNLYPFPEVDLNDAEAVANIIASAPGGALIFVVIAWAIGAFVAGAASALLAKSHKTEIALITGGILMVFGVINLTMLPHPEWMWIAGLLSFIPMAYLGSLIINK